MVTGVILGAPTLRVRGDYLAIVTLGFGEIIRITVTNIEWLGASAGIKDIPSRRASAPTRSATDEAGCSRSRTWCGTGSPAVDLDHKTAFLSFGVLDAIPYYWLILTALLLVLLGDCWSRRAGSAEPGRQPARTRTPPS